MSFINMTARLKIMTGFLIAAFWLATLALKHVWPDIDIGGLTMAYTGGLAAIGVHSALQIKQVLPQQPDQ